MGRGRGESCPGVQPGTGEGKARVKAEMAFLNVVIPGFLVYCCFPFPRTHTLSEAYEMEALEAVVSCQGSKGGTPIGSVLWPA